jgi:fumarylacetoacetase
MMLDATHDRERRSWVASANGHQDFPIQNLPLGVFTTAQDAVPRIGVAIGDEVLDLKAASQAGVFQGSGLLTAACLEAATLNPLMAAGSETRRQLRARLSDCLTEGSRDQAAVAPLLLAAGDCTLHLPAVVGDYTDFYAGVHHALNVGRQFRPDQPLLPNYKYVPIGYHGRASSVVVSGTSIRRPAGQRKPPADAVPTVGPSTRLDYELELGVWIGPGNSLGDPVAIANASDHIAGFCLLNDWSARDLQAWEYQPLGPFLAKSFATSVSPWVITPEALLPFRMAQPRRPEGDPEPLDYLHDTNDQNAGAFDIELSVLLTTEQSRAARVEPFLLASSNTRHLYWTLAQLLTHHTSNGCNLRPGDLLGSGTISSPSRDGAGSLLELSEGGRSPISLPWGESRTFLEDGDEIVLRARGQREGYVAIGFGEVRGRILRGHRV